MTITPEEIIKAAREWQMEKGGGCRACIVIMSEELEGGKVMTAAVEQGECTKLADSMIMLLGRSKDFRAIIDVMMRRLYAIKMAAKRRATSGKKGLN